MDNKLTFYSTTDLSEIEDNSKHHNFYLSVVSNNRLELIGKLCFKCEVENTVCLNAKVKNEKGKLFNLKLNNSIPNKEDIICFDCDIIIPNNNIISETFKNRVEEICKPKTYKNLWSNMPQKEEQHIWGFDVAKDFKEKKNSFNFFGKTIPVETNEYNIEDSFYENFLYILFRNFFTDRFVKCNTLGDICNELEDNILNIKNTEEFYFWVNDNYLKLYEQYFKNVLGFMTEDVFMFITEEIARTLYMFDCDEFEEGFDFLPTLEKNRLLVFSEFINNLGIVIEGVEFKNINKINK